MVCGDNGGGGDATFESIDGQWEIISPIFRRRDFHQSCEIDYRHLYPDVASWVWSGASLGLVAVLIRPDTRCRWRAGNCSEYGRLSRRLPMLSFQPPSVAFVRRTRGLSPRGPYAIF